MKNTSSAWWKNGGRPLRLFPACGLVCRKAADYAGAGGGVRRPEEPLTGGPRDLSDRKTGNVPRAVGSLAADAHHLVAPSLEKASRTMLADEAYRNADLYMDHLRNVQVPWDARVGYTHVYSPDFTAKTLAHPLWDLGMTARGKVREMLSGRHIPVADIPDHARKVENAMRRLYGARRAVPSFLKAGTAGGKIMAAGGRVLGLGTKLAGPLAYALDAADVVHGYRNPGSWMEEARGGPLGALSAFLSAPPRALGETLGYTNDIRKERLRAEQGARNVEAMQRERYRRNVNRAPEEIREAHREMLSRYRSAPDAFGTQGAGTQNTNRRADDATRIRNRSSGA